MGRTGAGVTVAGMRKASVVDRRGRVARRSLVALVVMVLVTVGAGRAAALPMDPWAGSWLVPKA
jgi:hypothetical protein